MEMIFGSLIQIHLEVKLHFTSLHKAYCFKTIQDQRLFYHDQGGNRDSNQESSKCLLALFSFKIGKSALAAYKSALFPASATTSSSSSPNSASTSSG